MIAPGIARASCEGRARITLPFAAVLGAACIAGAAPGAETPRNLLRPPLRTDADNRPVPQPRGREVSEIYAIVYNSFLRIVNLESRIAAARDGGALNVNAWDEVPTSSWFNNRMGRTRLEFGEIVGTLKGTAPAQGPWKVLRVRDEGYTPKIDIQDATGSRYVLKFDLPDKPERNSAAERICTLIMHAAGYNVPYNSIVNFRPERLVLDDKSNYRDSIKRVRTLTSADMAALLGRLKARQNGTYRGLSSLMLSGGLGPFVYKGKREDDPNDVIPHELRRELRGMRVIAAWINHADVKDVNALDVYADGPNGKYVKHYMLDFGSTLGSGDFVNGPFRIGHEYIYDGSATGKAFVTLGFKQRPWEVNGKILHPEVGYYQAEYFTPEKWKPNYPNLAFLRMDDGDAYWGTKIVTAFSDGVIRRLAEEGEYSRPEVTDYVERVLLLRRDAIGKYWFDRVTPLEDFHLVAGGRALRFRDLALERGYAEAANRSYRVRVLNVEGREIVPWSAATVQAGSLKLPAAALDAPASASADRYGRKPVCRVLIQSKRRSGGWALPAEVVLGFGPGSKVPEALGWTHAKKNAR